MAIFEYIILPVYTQYLNI